MMLIWCNSRPKTRAKARRWDGEALEVDLQEREVNPFWSAIIKYGERDAAFICQAKSGGSWAGKYRWNDAHIGGDGAGRARC